MPRPANAAVMQATVGTHSVFKRETAAPCQQESMGGCLPSPLNAAAAPRRHCLLALRR